MKTTANTRYSIIIPAYNAERTISKCLESLLKQIQARTDIEIIIVNDGSLDQTEQICHDFMKDHQCIRYFHIENSGVSAARNIGLRNAKGEYIIFVDSDDFVEGSFLETIDSTVSKEWDICILNFQTFDGVNTYKGEFRQFRSKDYKEIMRYLTRYLKQQQLNTVYGKIFRYDLIKQNHVEFPEGLQIGEDKVFMARYMVNIRTLYVSDRIIYTVSSENLNSLSRMKRNTLCEDIITEHRYLFDLIDQTDFTDHEVYMMFARAVTYSFFRSAYTSVFELNKSHLSYRDSISEIRQILHTYNSQKVDIHRDLHAFLISLPVTCRMSFLMYLGMRLIAYRKNIVSYQN